MRYTLLWFLICSIVFPFDSFLAHAKTEVSAVLSVSINEQELKIEFLDLAASYDSLYTKPCAILFVDSSEIDFRSLGEEFSTSNKIQFLENDKLIIYERNSLDIDEEYNIIYRSYCTDCFPQKYDISDSLPWNYYNSANINGYFIYGTWSLKRTNAPFELIEKIVNNEIAIISVCCLKSESDYLFLYWLIGYE